MEFKKILSWNDCGYSRGHQSGVLITKSFAKAAFPSLTNSMRNPRIKGHLRSTLSPNDFPISVIYYNNRSFGGTKDEFRLTGITPFLNEISAKEGDTIVLELDLSDGLNISAMLQRG